MTENKNIWIVKFAYSGCGKREFFDREFTLFDGQDINAVINEYVKNQNCGEAKSDRIAYWSKKKQPLTH